MIIDKSKQDQKPPSKRDRRLLDLLNYRRLFGKKRSDDDISDLAIEQWKSEGKDCSKWELKNE